MSYTVTTDQEKPKNNEKTKDETKQAIQQTVLLILQHTTCEGFLFSVGSQSSRLLTKVAESKQAHVQLNVADGLLLLAKKI